MDCEEIKRLQRYEAFSRILCVNKKLKDLKLISCVNFAIVHLCKFIDFVVS